MLRQQQIGQVFSRSLCRYPRAEPVGPRPSGFWKNQGYTEKQLFKEGYLRPVNFGDGMKHYRAPLFEGIYAIVNKRICSAL